MREWITARGNWRGALFCCCDTGDAIVRRALAAKVFNVRLKLLLEAIGENSAPYGAHSLRSGMVTTSAENGADVIVIMQRTGHRSVQTVMKYVRPARAFRADPLAGVL
jgi:integrase